MKHNKSLINHPLYGKRSQIISRCYDKNNKAFKNYGARGISVFNEWRHDPKAFIDYITALPGYGEAGLTLDRIDNDGNYEPGNLRFTDWKTQNMNKRIYKNNKLETIHSDYLNFKEDIQ